MQKCNIKTVFRNTNTIQQHLRKGKQCTDNKACIYEIPCQNCNKSYIGETIDFNRRQRQHRDSLTRGDENSAIFQHRQRFNHKICMDKMERIVDIDNVEKRRLLESILIQNVDTFNVYKSNFKLESFLNTIMVKHVPSVGKLLNKVRKPP